MKGPFCQVITCSLGPFRLKSISDKPSDYSDWSHDPFLPILWVRRTSRSKGKAELDESPGEALFSAKAAHHAFFPRQRRKPIGSNVGSHLLPFLPLLPTRAIRSRTHWGHSPVLPSSLPCSTSTGWPSWRLPSPTPILASVLHSQS